jgi:hypothetical protein
LLCFNARKYEKLFKIRIKYWLSVVCLINVSYLCEYQYIKNDDKLFDKLDRQPIRCNDTNNWRHPQA